MGGKRNTRHGKTNPLHGNFFDSRYGQAKSRMWSKLARQTEGQGSYIRFVSSTNIVQTRQAGTLPTVDIQTSFHQIIGILDMEVAPIQSANCADWPSKHLSLAS